MDDLTNIMEDLTTTTSDVEYVQQSAIPYSTFVIVEYFLVSCIFAFTVFGIFTNTTNILVFRRQGIFSNSPTVCLFALAISDLCYCILGTFTLPFAILRIQLDWRKDLMHFEFMMFRPGDYFSQITCWVTAYAAFERMISVVLPFKVKSIFSSKRSLIVIICIFAGFFMLHFPFFIERLPGWTVSPWNANESYYGIQFVPEVYQQVYVNSLMVLRVTSIFIVIVCNIVIFSKVNLSQKFRKSLVPATVKTEIVPNSTNKGGKSDSKSVNETDEGVKNASGQNKDSKEMVLLRMIMIISVVFTIAYTMNIMYYLFFVLIFKFYLYEYWYILDFLGFEVVMVFQAINSSTNCVIYYTMSSRFRQEFLALVKKLRGSR